MAWPRGRALPCLVREAAQAALVLVELAVASALGPAAWPAARRGGLVQTQGGSTARAGPNSHPPKWGLQEVDSLQNNSGSDLSPDLFYYF